MLARMQIGDGALSFSDSDLCFRLAETVAFFSEFRDLRLEEIAEIHDRTGGWPAALQGFRLCLRRGGPYRAGGLRGKGMPAARPAFPATAKLATLPPDLCALMPHLRGHTGSTWWWGR